MAEFRKEFTTLLERVLATLQIELSLTQISQLAAHFELLQRWNQRINLTGLQETAEIVERHFGESLFTGMHIPCDAQSLVDVGSGAGFPGLPIAVLRPNLTVALVESVAKKAAFLREACRRIDNAYVYHGRFDTLPEAFEWATVRGVAAEGIWGDLKERAQCLAILPATMKLAALQSLGGVRWEPAKPLPWGRGRVLLVGGVEDRRARST